MTLSRKEALTLILEQSDIITEEGDKIVDFTPRGRDCHDFTVGIARWTLEDLMTKAYEAGKAARP